MKREFLLSQHRKTNPFPQLMAVSNSFKVSFRLTRTREKAGKNKTLSFSYSRMRRKSTHTYSKIFKKELDFLSLFAIYHYVMSNDAKLWQTQKGLKL